MPADTVTDLVRDRVADGALVAPQVTLVEDAVRVDALVEAPVGQVPVEIYVDFSVDRGELVIAPGEVLVAGRAVPEGMLGGRAVDSGIGGADARRDCSAWGADERYRLTDVEVGRGGLVVTVTV